MIRTQREDRFARGSTSTDDKLRLAYPLVGKKNPIRGDVKIKGRKFSIVPRSTERQPYDYPSPERGKFLCKEVLKQQYYLLISFALTLIVLLASDSPIVIRKILDT